MTLEKFWIQSLSNLLAPILPSQRVFILYLASAFILAALSFLWFRSKDEGARPEGIRRGLWGYIFDPSVWWHKSARQDYLFFMLNAMVYYGIISQLLLGGHMFYNTFDLGLVSAFGVRVEPVFEASWLSVALYTLAVVLAIDLAVYVTHYMQHRVQVLWQFHQVHHSAEVLTPMTVYRMHPVDLFFTGLLTVVLISFTLALFVYLTGARPSQITVLNVNVGTFAFYLLGYNLRHSHIWLNYPRWLSFIFISPAQHQTHHSRAERHWDRNYGLIFAFWDWVFGTLYVPKGYEKLSFGIAGPDPNPFKSVRDIYLLPFRNAWALLAPKDARRTRRLVAMASLGGAALVYLAIHFSAATAGDRDMPSLHLEALTWTEVDAAIKAGYATVIVPTGGVEQNGPHMILGKHNHIMRETADRIARRLGHTLVAPVMAYVPEGASGEVPDGHMRWPGTISLPEPVFALVLEETARSLRTHGFRNILLIGDSGGNQAAQAEVAAKLSAEWLGEGVRVLHVGGYYTQNGQADWLIENGHAENSIGNHAGIRDTSELLAVHPEGVRQRPVAAPKGADPGYSGAISRASAEIGKVMLELKVQAALAELRALGIDSGRSIGIAQN